MRRRRAARRVHRRFPGSEGGLGQRHAARKGVRRDGGAVDVAHVHAGEAQLQAAQGAGEQADRERRDVLRAGGESAPPRREVGVEPPVSRQRLALLPVFLLRVCVIVGL